MDKNTMAYQLAVLRDTQMVQRRQLEAWYPYIDWEKMPFSSYGDFFRLRGILDDCGEVWTNAYGRSNTEADGQRNFLKDYSGKGRDIELFNFGYSKQSGYNGYVYGMTSFLIPGDVTGNATESSISVTNTLESGGTYAASYYNVSAELKTKSWKVFVEKEDDVNVRISWFSADYSKVKKIPLNNGLNTISGLTEEESSVYLSMAIELPQGKSVKITEIPSYPGAIVGDGVDDYGQCVSDFALPDDYTVVAMREILNGGNAGIINKTSATSQGAFIFEYAGTQSYSYGDNYSGLSAPKLFSYQTKASYNGTVLTPGTGADTADDKLLIFRLRDGVSNYISAALYSFGIFNRTLTADELRIVENCMYAEWIAMTGKLEDIEYYDILDARFRSNDEDADKRNKWVGRFGKLHMTLNNYAFTGMSGWDGSTQDFRKIDKKNDIEIIRQSQFSLTYVKTENSTASIVAALTDYINKAWKVKSSDSIVFYVWNGKSSSVVFSKSIPAGIWTEIPAIEPEYTEVGFSGTKGKEITIELIPDYGGALVSDGVDDYAVSDEVIDEEIGGMVMLAEKISDPATSYGNIFSSSVGLGGSTGKEIAGLISKGSDSIIMGDPWTSFGKNEDAAYGLDRSPIAPNNKLMVGNNNSNEWGNAALYQLRLIKTQPTDIQLEAIKWQCRKEHDDYLIHRGWKEVE